MRKLILLIFMPYPLFGAKTAWAKDFWKEFTLNGSKVVHSQTSAEVEDKGQKTSPIEPSQIRKTEKIMESKKRLNKIAVDKKRKHKRNSDSVRTKGSLNLPELTLPPPTY